MGFENTDGVLDPALPLTFPECFLPLQKCNLFLRAVENQLDDTQLLLIDHDGIFCDFVHFGEFLPFIKRLLEFELQLQNHSLANLPLDFLFYLVLSGVILRRFYLLDLKNP